MQLSPKKQKQIARIEQLVKGNPYALIEYLLDIEDRLDNELPAIAEIIAKVKGDKGDDYEITDEDKEEIIIELGKLFVNDNRVMLKIAKMVDVPIDTIAREAAKHVKVEHGKTPTANELLGLIRPLIPKKVNVQEVATEALYLIDSRIRSLIPDMDLLIFQLPKYVAQIRDGLELLEGDERLDKKYIRGIEDIEKRIEEMSTATSKHFVGGARKLSLLLDTNIQNPTNGQVLKYNSVTKLWVNDADAGGVTTSSDGSLTIAGTDAIVNVAHNFPWTGLHRFNRPDVTYTPQPVAGGSSITISFIPDGGGFVASGTDYSYYVYGYYEVGGSGVYERAFDATGTFVQSVDPTDSNTYNVQIDWTVGTDCNGYYIYDFNTGLWLDVGNVTTYTVTPSSPWGVSGSLFSPTSINDALSGIWSQSTTDFNGNDFTAMSIGGSTSYGTYLRLAWRYTGAGGNGALRFEDSDTNLKYINANVYAENINVSNALQGGTITGSLYPGITQYNVAYGGSGGVITGDARFSFNDSTNRLLIGNTGITAQSQLHLHQSGATALYSQYTNSNTGSTSSDGLQIGITTTGVAQIVQKEALNIEFYTSNTLRCFIGNNGLPMFGCFGQGEFARSGIGSTSSDGLDIANQTSATNGARIQNPGRFRMTGHIWDTGASATRVQDFILDVRGTDGNPGTAVWATGYQYNAAGYTYLMNFSSSGRLHIGNGVVVGSANLHVTSGVAEVARFTRSSSNNAAVAFSNSSGTMYTGLASVGTTYGIATTADIGADYLWNITTAGLVSHKGGYNLVPTGAGGAGTNRTIDFGSAWGNAALFLYNAGASSRFGWGMQADAMQFFAPTTTGGVFTWNRGGDLQATGTNEILRLQQYAAGTGAGLGLGSTGFAPTTPYRIDFQGVSATTGAAGTEDILRFSRIQTGGVSYPEAFTIGLGRYSSSGTGPDTRVDFNLKSIAATDYVADKTVMRMRSDGDVEVALGGSTSFAKLGGTIFDHITDSTVGGAEADIYTDTLAASTLGTNGDKIIASYSGNFVTVGTELTQLQVYFGGTSIWDSTGVAPSTGTTSWRVYVEVIRVSATVVRYTVSLNTTGASGYVYAKSGELTGLTLSNTNVIKITGTSSGVGSGSGDIVGKMGYIEFLSAA